MKSGFIVWKKAKNEKKWATIYFQAISAEGNHIRRASRQDVSSDGAHLEPYMLSRPQKNSADLSAAVPLS